jgi:hypothetical protein
MGAFINAMREEGTREEILEALAETLQERDFLRSRVISEVEEMRQKCEMIAAAEHERTRLPCRLVAGRIADAILALREA